MDFLKKQDLMQVCGGRAPACLTRSQVMRMVRVHGSFEWQALKGTLRASCIREILEFESMAIAVNFTDEGWRQQMLRGPTKIIQQISGTTQNDLICSAHLGSLVLDQKESQRALSH